MTWGAPLARRVGTRKGRNPAHRRPITPKPKMQAIDQRIFDRFIARSLQHNFDSIDGAVTPDDKDGKLTRQELQAVANSAPVGSELRETADALLTDEQRFDRYDASAVRDGAISRRDISVFLDLTKEAVDPGPPPVLPAWTKQATVPYPGKQDDIFFVNAKTGWYVNGTQGPDKAGRIYKTEDGGVTWTQVYVSPGTFFRTIGFIDEQHGFAGNIGPDYFPNVADPVPLYETKDGGATWKAVEAITGPTPKGLCAIDVARVPYIHSGHTEYRTLLHAAGRVGGPAYLMRSEDEGRSWTSQDLGAHLDMITDVKFMNEKRGFVVGAKIEDGTPRAVILATSDGGATWSAVYNASTAGNLIWKIAFPTAQVGYATLLGATNDPAASQQRIAKTTDGGASWKELPLVDNANAQELGVGFVDANRGWVGTTIGGFYTADGGATWAKAPGLGRAANKLRFVSRPDGATDVFAIGVEVNKVTIPPPAHTLRNAHLSALASKR